MAESPLTTNNNEDSTEEQKIQAAMAAAQDMKISELKMKLMAKGVLTSTFCEKHEFVRAYAETVVKEQAKGMVDATAALQAASIDDENDVDVDDDEDEGLPECIRQRVDKLKELHDQREELRKEYLAERAKLEAKYHQLEQPLFEQRKNIVLGNMDEEIAKELGGCTSESSSEKGIPQFWVVALSQMPVTGEMITEQDVDCLGYLQDITFIDNEHGDGFELQFHFAPNDYFENAVLTKTYEVPNLLLADEPILKNVEGCEIQWKPGKCLTEVEVTKQQRGKGKNAGQVRTITKKERSESFFQFFTPPKMPSLETMDEEEAMKLEAAFEEDYDVAQAFRSHVIPKAVEWFNGNAMEKEMEAAMEGLEWPPGVKNATPNSDGENPECKQQ
jgi:nucleosome assembly protein 1-like 1